MIAEFVNTFTAGSLTKYVLMAWLATAGPATPPEYVATFPTETDCQSVARAMPVLMAYAETKYVPEALAITTTATQTTPPDAAYFCVREHASITPATLPAQE